MRLLTNKLSRVAASAAILLFAGTMYSGSLTTGTTSIKYTGARPDALYHDEAAFMYEFMPEQPDFAVPSSTNIIGVYTLPDAFNNGSGLVTYTGTKTYESTDKITHGLPGLINDLAQPDEMGFMKLDNRYLVAIGTGFGVHVGQYFDIVLENGVSIPCIMGDTKADKDTDPTNIFTRHSKCATEFIVKIDLIPREVSHYGNVSKIRPEWSAKAKNIIAYDKYFDGNVDNETVDIPEIDVVEISEPEVMPESAENVPEIDETVIEEIM